MILYTRSPPSPPKISMRPVLCDAESCPASGTTFPHVLPLLCLLEKCVALDEGPPGAGETPGAEAWETAEAGADIDVLMFHLGAARKDAQLGAVYAANARSKLQGSRRRMCLRICTCFASRVFLIIILLLIVFSHTER